ncbi:hypothetical protein [Duganella radicis]|uniref:Uncharacterized protein n=1 Tax=Duganella radicis TaxID=551988 RepID=A0A6L6PS98_9BURK|nr:hypothetical protein [Duganella radicis]MTV41938.1 hypothetical protein [Duganella radicis]
MGWHILGNRILSDKEMHAKSGEFLDIAVPSVPTGIIVWILTEFLPKFHFFVVHTTTTKLIYVGVGIIAFLMCYAYRKLIATLAVIAFFGFILFCAGMTFLEWVAK